MAARVVLTEKAIEKARPADAGKRNFLWDAVAPSLALRITDRGHKSWIVQRRVAGAMRRLTLGDYPLVSLATAREKAQAILGLMAKGVDPKHAPVADKVALLGKASARREDSFEGLAESYLRREAERYCRPRTAEAMRYTLLKVFAPHFGSRSLGEITSREVRAILDEIVDAGHLVSANRHLTRLKRLFNWAVERETLAVNPVANMKKPAKEASRNRVLGSGELRAVWAACNALGWPFCHMFRTLILTGQRRNECAAMTWGEVDLQKRIWSLGADRTKNGREHQVPISDAMLAILTDAPRKANPEEVEYIFTTNFKTPSTGYSRAKRRLDKIITQACGKPLPAWTIHDVRRSVATGLAEDIKVPPHVVETILNHVSGFRAGVAGVYQHAKYWEERIGALQAWGKHIAGPALVPLEQVKP